MEITFLKSKQTKVGDRRFLVCLIFIFCVAIVLDGCSRYWDYIPKESVDYVIDGKKIRYNNGEISLSISGVYALSDRYLATFDIIVSSMKDTLYGSFSEIKFIADSMPREIRFVRFSSADIEAESKEIFPPNMDQHIKVRLEVLGNYSLNISDVFSDVALDLHSVFQIKEEAIKLPQFQFVAVKE